MNYFMRYMIVYIIILGTHSNQLEIIMTNLKYKSLALAACLIAGISFTAAGYAANCRVNGGAIVQHLNCKVNDYVKPSATCSYKYQNYKYNDITPSLSQPIRILAEECNTTGAITTFVCGAPNPPAQTGLWFKDSNKNWACKSG